MSPDFLSCNYFVYINNRIGLDGHVLYQVNKIASVGKPLKGILWNSHFQFRCPILSWMAYSMKANETHLFYVCFQTSMVVKLAIRSSSDALTEN